ncbi:MAG TPA: response regulator transcription factor [Myxococcota bacterium]|nr:response regulator transcription factor [Myxococcota bacterium]
MPDAENKGNILVVDDEPQITRVLKTTLSSQGYGVRSATDGEEALDEMKTWAPDLIITDLRMPRMDGLELCRRVRKDSRIPIIVLSVKGEEATKVEALDAGADDYITKPFSTLEFAARVRAHRRRFQAAQQQATPQVVTVGELRIDLAARSIRREGQPIHLTPIEWDLLRTLVAQAGRTLTHRQLFQAVWGQVSGDPQQYLRVHVANLRRKIERDPVRPRLIVTEPGVGYRFESS